MTIQPVSNPIIPPGASPFQSAVVSARQLNQRSPYFSATSTKAVVNQLFDAAPMDQGATASLQFQFQPASSLPNTPSNQHLVLFAKVQQDAQVPDGLQLSINTMQLQPLPAHLADLATATFADTAPKADTPLQAAYLRHDKRLVKAGQFADIGLQLRVRTHLEKVVVWMGQNIFKGPLANFIRVDADHNLQIGKPTGPVRTLSWVREWTTSAGQPVQMLALTKDAQGQWQQVVHQEASPAEVVSAEVAPKSLLARLQDQVSKLEQSAGWKLTHRVVHNGAPQTAILPAEQGAVAPTPSTSTTTAVPQPTFGAQVAGMASSPVAASVHMAGAETSIASVPVVKKDNPFSFANMLATSSGFEYPKS
jgi:hypothetical protein